MSLITDKSAPMPSAPMLYKNDGTVDWGNMWESFCFLALEGGPPHRGIMLNAQANPNTNSPDYQFALREIVRGIGEVSGLQAKPGEPGWIQIKCHNEKMAGWVGNAMIYENVETRVEGKMLFVPVGDDYALEGEIKNVITAVAKTTHYWQEHLPNEVKIALTVQHWLGRQKRQLHRLVGM